MAEVAAVVGFVSATMQLCEYGYKLTKRLNDFHKSTTDIPRAFDNIRVELPLLLRTLERTKKQAEINEIDEETQKALLPLVERCTEQINQLEKIFQKSLPDEGDSSLQKSLKALTSLAKDKKVEEITSTLRNYMSTLTHFHASGIPALKRAPTMKAHFMVPFDRDTNFIGRKDILDELEAAYAKEKRVALSGIGGVG
jgi:nucleoid-associated protein YejK